MSKVLALGHLLCYESGCTPAAAQLAQLARALSGEPPVEGGTPWIGWAAVSVIRYRALHRRICEYVSLAELSADGVWEEPSHALLGWRLHIGSGRAAAVSTVTGEHIELAVERTASGALACHPDTIRPNDFARWIVSLVVGSGEDVETRARRARLQPELLSSRRLPRSRMPEARLWRWLPSPVFLAELVGLLATVGVVEPIEPADGRPGYRITTVCEAMATAIAEEDFADASTSIRWLDHLGDTDLDTRSHRDPLVIAHRTWLQRVAGALDPMAQHTMLPLHSLYLEPVELVWCCDSILARAADAWQVVRFLVDRPHLPISRGVGRLLSRLNIASPRALWEVAPMATHYLALRGISTPRLADSAGLYFGDRELARHVSHFMCHPDLSLQHMPVRTRDLVRQALRSRRKNVVRDVAATLVLAQPSWHRELELAHAAVPMHQLVIREAVALLPKIPGNIPSLVGPNELAVAIDRYRHNREMELWAHG